MAALSRKSAESTVYLTQLITTGNLNIVEKVVKPAIRRELVDHVRLVHKVSLRLACRAFGISDSVYS